MEYPLPHGRGSADNNVGHEGSQPSCAGPEHPAHALHAPGELQPSHVIFSDSLAGLSQIQLRTSVLTNFQLRMWRVSHRFSWLEMTAHEVF